MLNVTGIPDITGVVVVGVANTGDSDTAVKILAKLSVAEKATNSFNLLTYKLQKSIFKDYARVDVRDGVAKIVWTKTFPVGGACGHAGQGSLLSYGETHREQEAETGSPVLY